MNEERAKDLIRQAQAHMNGEATSQAIAALTTVDEEHKMFLGNLYVASWQSSPANIGAPWQATLTIHSTQAFHAGWRQSVLPVHLPGQRWSGSRPSNSRMKWCTPASIAAAVAMGLAKMRSHSEKTRFDVRPNDRRCRFGDEGEEDLRFLGALGQVAQVREEVEVVQLAAGPQSRG